MSALQDIWKRTLYMSIFIMLIPIGAYTIHTGSSAVVALVSYVLLSICIPFWYTRSKDSGFGNENIRVRPLNYIGGWVLIHALTFAIFAHMDLSMLWGLSTIGRDIVFIIAMYIQVVCSLIVGYGLSRLGGTRA